VGWQLDWVLLDGCEVGLLDYVLGWKPRDQVSLPRAELDDLRRALTVGSRLDLQIDEVETQHEQVLGTNHPSALIGWRPPATLPQRRGGHLGRDEPLDHN